MNLPAKEYFTDESKVVARAIELPVAPIVIANEPGDLKNSEIEIHLMEGSIDYGKLISLDQNNQILRYTDVNNMQEKLLQFSKLKFILFTRELEYQYGNHPTSSHSESTEIPEKPQSFSISFDLIPSSVFSNVSYAIRPSDSNDLIK